MAGRRVTQATPLPPCSITFSRADEATALKATRLLVRVGLLAAPWRRLCRRDWANVAAIYSSSTQSSSIAEAVSSATNCERIGERFEKHHKDCLQALHRCPGALHSAVALNSAPTFEV